MLEMTFQLIRCACRTIRIVQSGLGLTGLTVVVLWLMDLKGRIRGSA
jgi:hypothetical protein